MGSEVAGHVGASARKRRHLWIWVAVAGALLAGVVVAMTAGFGGEDQGDKGAWATVRRGPLVISITESGTIKNREQVVIKNEVEGRVAILSLVKEGIQVRPGDLLVELDSSKLMDQKASQQITVINTEAAWVRARENQAVTRSQGESDVAKAAQDLYFAELDREKYVKGEYPQQLQQADADIAIAKEEVERAKEKLAWSQKLHAQRYLSKTELDADDLTLQKAELELTLAEGRKDLLENYTNKRDMAALETNIELAKSALERTRRRAAADLVQADAELRAREQEYQRQKQQLGKLEDQILKCRILAPTGGMVVYATTGKGGYRGDETPLQEGREVREREELIYLPTAASMMAEVKIHESSLQKVRVSMPVRVTVDAMPGKSWDGVIARIGVLPDAQDRWMNPDLKLYNSEVHLEGSGGDLRTGMTCRGEIFVDRYEDALSIPVQCVLRVAGKPRVYVRGKRGPEPRDIEIGMDNNQVVHVLKGLEEGEQVLMEPPLEHATPAPAAPPPEIPPAASGAPPAKPAPAPAEGNGAAAGTDWRNLSPEERRKRFEQLSPEEKAKLMEQARRRGANGEGRGNPPGGGEGAGGPGNGDGGGTREGK
jgi:HlyD family secretion protein